jgi:SnoaL-like domain
MTDAHLADAIRNLVARQQIQDTLYRYCRGVDRCDVALVRSAFHPTAVNDHGPESMSAHEFAERVVTRHSAGSDFSVHRVSNPLIEFVNAETAVCESLVLSIQRAVGGAQTQFSCSRYLDRFDFREGDWKIGYRLVAHDWDGSAELDAWTMRDLDIDSFEPSRRGEMDVILGGRERLFRPLAPS